MKQTGSKDCARSCAIEFAGEAGHPFTMHRFDTPRRSLAYGIAALAGFVDASGFIAAGGYFVSFMSGNTTRLGVDLAAQLGEALTPALLIAGFVCGVVVGAVAAERGGHRRKSAVLGTSIVFLLIAAVGQASGLAPVFLAGSVVAMGAINNAFRRDGEVAIGVTYMTGALVRLGQGIAARILGKPFEGALAHLALWASLAVGAVVGALASGMSPSAAPWIALAVAGGLFFAARGIERSAL